MCAHVLKRTTYLEVIKLKYKIQYVGKQLCQTLVLLQVSGNVPLAKDIQQTWHAFLCRIIFV